MSVQGISLLVPTYNRAALLRQTLNSLMQLKRPEGCLPEILVVDNNCTDATGEVVDVASRSSAIPVRRVSERAQGLNYGRNRAVRDARYEEVVFFDDDVRVARDWLVHYCEARETFSADCVVGPVYPWFEGSVPAYASERVLDSVSSAYSRRGDKARILGAEEAFQIPGSNFAVQRSVALKVGGFDPALDRAGAGMLAGGDWDFGRKLVRGGYSVVYVPGCRVEHFISREKLSRRGLRQRWYGLGRTHRRISAEVEFSRSRTLRSMVSCLMRSAGCAVRGESAAAFEAELCAIRHLGYWVG